MLPGHTSAEVCDPKVDRPEGRRPRTHVASLASTPSGTFRWWQAGGGRVRRVLSDLGDRGVF